MDVPSQLLPPGGAVAASRIARQYPRCATRSPHVPLCLYCAARLPLCAASFLSSYSWWSSDGSEMPCQSALSSSNRRRPAAACAARGGGNVLLVHETRCHRERRERSRRGCKSTMGIYFHADDSSADMDDEDCIDAENGSISALASAIKLLAVGCFSLCLMHELSLKMWMISSGCFAERCQKQSSSCNHKMISRI